MAGDVNFTGEELPALLTAPIEDYLVALANGLGEAQRRLDQATVGRASGRPAVTYQLPRLDFELKVSFDLATTQTWRGGTVAEGGGNTLRLRPVDASSRTATAQAASTLKGTFVAMPADGGRPQPVIQTAVIDTSDRELTWDLLVSVRGPNGEPLSGVSVQFNVDRDLSDRLTQAAAGVRRVVGPTSGVRFGYRVTDAQGRASTEVRIDPAEVAGSAMVVRVDVLDLTETIVFSAPAAAAPSGG